MADLLEVEDALRRVLDRVPSVRAETVDLADAAGRALAAEVRADADHPAFRRSKVDGYAVCAAAPADPDTELPVVLDVPAGSEPDGIVGPGEAARVFTGAAVPESADAVVMQEHCEASDGTVRVLRWPQAGLNVVPVGDECRAGAVVASPGDVVTPALLGVLASVGAARLEVGRRPVARIVSTGDELVPVESTPGPGQIRNSNAYALAAAARGCGAEVAGAEVAADTDEAHERAIATALEADLALVTGGVSVGDYDLVPRVLDRLGVETVFHGVGLQPGKPLWFGVRGDTLVFGLPGNPVSALVNVALFVAPAVRKWTGLPDPGPRLLTARVTGDLRGGTWRRRYVPARLGSDDEGHLTVAPVAYRGSGDVFGFACADALIVVAIDAPACRAGTPVRVVPLGNVGP